MDEKFMKFTYWRAWLIFMTPSTISGMVSDFGTGWWYIHAAVLFIIIEEFTRLRDETD